MMNNIKAILVDDEQNARDNLTFLLNDFCKNVTIVAKAENVAQAIQLIDLHNPDLIFLDIEMPNKNGFDLINHYDNVNFCVIFVTAYDRYAIKAFDVSAVDYLLKPIDVDRLQESVTKVIQNLVFKKVNKRIQALKENTKNKVIKHISIPYKNDYVVVPIEKIAAIEANRMYSLFHLNGKKTTYLYAKKLSFFEQLLGDNSSFHRVHRSWIVNTNEISTYSKKEATIKLKNDIQIPVSKSHKATFEKIIGF